MDPVAKPKTPPGWKKHWQEFSCYLAETRKASFGCASSKSKLVAPVSTLTDMTYLTVKTDAWTYHYRASALHTKSGEEGYFQVEVPFTAYSRFTFEIRRAGARWWDNLFQWAPPSTGIMDFDKKYVTKSSTPGTFNSVLQIAPLPKFLLQNPSFKAASRWPYFDIESQASKLNENTHALTLYAGELIYKLDDLSSIHEIITSTANTLRNLGVCK